LAGILRPGAGPSIRSDSGGWAGPAGGAGRSAWVCSDDLSPGQVSFEFLKKMLRRFPVDLQRSFYRELAESRDREVVLRQSYALLPQSPHCFRYFICLSRFRFENVARLDHLVYCLGGSRVSFMSFLR